MLQMCCLLLACHDHPSRLLPYYFGNGINYKYLIDYSYSPPWLNFALERKRERVTVQNQDGVLFTPK